MTTRSLPLGAQSDVSAEPQGVLETGSPSESGYRSIKDAQRRWAINIWAGKGIRVSGGAGEGQASIIESNSENELFLTPVLRVQVDTSSTYVIFDLGVVAAQDQSAPPLLQALLEEAQEIRKLLEAIA